MSTTIVSTIIIILSALLPKIGVEIGNDALTTTVTTLLTLGAAIWIWVQRWKRGDIKPMGARK